MSSPESNLSLNKEETEHNGNNCETTPGRGKFNVTRTSEIARSGVPLVVPASSGGRAPSSPSGISPTGQRGTYPTPSGRAVASPSVSPCGTPPLAPQRPPHALVSAVAASSGGPPSRGPTPTSQGTPPLAPRMTPVPLITPRYQKKSRTSRAMELTDSFSEHSVNANELRRRHATENLTVTNGPQQYQQEVHFHTYEMYKHGSRQIHTRSIGYSSDGDIVMTREDCSEPSDVDNSVTRHHTAISNPIVLDPTARRPLTDSELGSKRKLHLRRPRYKKYPGVYAPRNKKLRNRLMNDFFVNEQAMRLLQAARERRDDGVDDMDLPPPKPSFQDLPPAVLKAFDLSDAAQERELERLGATRSPNTNYVQPPRDPDSAEVRFQKLNSRLRGELQHALSSEFLSQQIEDLEVCFSELIDRGHTDESLVFRFRDGYGRLVCHGVAAYYQLVSESRQAPDGTTKLTYVSFPKSKKASTREIHLPYASLSHVLRGNRSNVPARHPLSAGNTPVQMPQRSPAKDAERVPILGGDGEMLEVEPLSPLDLNAAHDFSIPPPFSSTGLVAPEERDLKSGTRRDGKQETSNDTTTAAAEQEGGEDAYGTFGPANDLVSSASSSTLDGHGEETAQRTVLVNPTVAMTVQGRLAASEVPIYVPHLQLKELARVVEQGSATTMDGGRGITSRVNDLISSSSSSDDEEEEEEW